MLGNMYINYMHSWIVHYSDALFMCDRCYGICERYQYTVELSGVGSPPADSGHLGHCSQMAVFSRRQRVSYLSAVVGTPYKIVRSCFH